MIEGRIPELTIKFTQKPFLPAQGKKALVEIKTENHVTIKAEVNRKSLRKQVEKMDAFEDWVGALSGKIKKVYANGMIELEGAGVAVYEKKKKEPKPEETAAEEKVAAPASS